MKHEPKCGKCREPLAVTDKLGLCVECTKALDAWEKAPRITAPIAEHVRGQREDP